MKQSKKFSDIIERIEYLRNLLKLNKSRFSSDIGMKPQTYNNFIGAQGSKPNIELIHGIVNKYGVNPMWLLNGTGAIFLKYQNEPDYRAMTASGRLGVQEGILAHPGGTGPEAIGALKEEMKELEPLLENVETKIKQLEREHLPIVERYIGLIRRYFDIDPISAIEEYKELLKRMQVRIGNENQKPNEM